MPLFQIKVIFKKDETNKSAPRFFSFKLITYNFEILSEKKIEDI